jgi:hypothetical protein
VTGGTRGLQSGNGGARADASVMAGVILYIVTRTWCKICRCVDVSMCRCVDVSMCRCVDVSMCRCVDVSMCRCVDVSMCRCVDVSMCRCVDVSMCRCVDVSMCRCLGRIPICSAPDVVSPAPPTRAGHGAPVDPTKPLSLAVSFLSGLRSASREELVRNRARQAARGCLVRWDVSRETHWGRATPAMFPRLI